jgi:3-methylfumaryl-CoA hydratase
VSSVSEWQSWIGHRTTAEEVLDPQQANRMAATLDREPTFRADDPLPPAWQWLYFHDVVPGSQLGEDGHPRLGVTMPPVPFRRRMWAGGRLDFYRPLRLGDRVRRESTFRSIELKQGRSGPLCFVTVEHEITTAGTRNLLEQQTIVYRDTSSAVGSDQGPVAPGGAEYTTRWVVDDVTLFRFSALTFNGHRIHYDAEYARSVEGYPGLVVHGPLIALLLLDLAHRENRPVGQFTYRARSPLFLPSGFSVNGAGLPGGTRLWAASDSGRLAMEAEVREERT